MAFPQSGEGKERPEAGQILIVIHDFSARSSDELSLLKGDRVELIERDDDFGDGWYLGRHLMNGNSGLFPEVYTRIAPRGPPSYPPTASSPPQPSPSTFAPLKEELVQPSPTKEEPLPPIDLSIPKTIVEEDVTPQGSRHVSEVPDLAITTSPSTATNPPPKTDNNFLATTMVTPPEASIQPKSLTTTVKQAHAHGQDSPVMNETLSVIDEHITDMNSPHHSIAGTDRRGGNDSGSEYSSHVDQRLSYINGEETDEEEEDTIYTREQVEKWSPDEVAEYLFTSAVEPKHCDVFREQEITGDVLLGMDQTSVFLKEFDLGSVGRRLKTWQKIKLLQDAVNGGGVLTRRNTSNYGSEVGSEDAGRYRSQSMTTSSMLPRIPSMNQRPGNSRLSQQHTARSETQLASSLPKNAPEISSRPVAGARRPSAASVRDMHHSRQSSANELSTSSLIGAVSNDAYLTSPRIPDTSHKKQASFDRTWTMGAAATSPSMPSRPMSSSGLKDIAKSSTDKLSPNTNAPNFDTLDRGYFSGGEAEGKSRNVLRKRGSTTTHSRNSSYTDEQRQRSATANSRHSRFGSVDSMRDLAPPSAAQKYYGLTVNGRRRTPSETSLISPPRPTPPLDTSSPIVTKLDTNSNQNNEASKSPESRIARGSDWLLPVKPLSNRQLGLRAISDAVTGNEKSRVTSPIEPLPSPTPKDSPLQSPARTGSTTPSAGPSFDLDSPKGATTPLTTPGSSKAAKKKSKKETSAYTRGLQKISPQKQIETADYSGWMKKKSTNLMTTWKPRLFILNGRRLSYYYSENDTEEKGLIDISYHRVLPADTDRLTGLHATLTGATNSPTSPPGAYPTNAEQDAAAQPESSLTKGSDSMFIFKLVPPRAGLSRAVSFTKPTVHYFAVPNIKQGRLWMAALMKATIDRDDSKPITTTYQQKTISLAKAQKMRHRPPALMNLDEKIDEEALKTSDSESNEKNGLNIQGLAYDKESQEGDSGVSGVLKPESAKEFNEKTGLQAEPRTA